MALVLLTEKDTGTVFDLTDSAIYEVVLDPLTPFTGSKILYGNVIYNGWTGTRFVTETPAQVAAMCENLIKVTFNSADLYLNKDQIVTVVSDGSTGSNIEFFYNGATSRPINVAESPTVIRNLVAAEEDETKTPTSTAITGATVLTAAQTATGRLETSGAPYNVTLPSATALAAYIGATAGSTFTLKINNAAGGIVTLVLGAGMTWGIVNSANTAASVCSEYRMVFQSATACMITRTM